MKHEHGICILSHDGLGIRVEHRGEWLPLLLELLRNPVSVVNLDAVLEQNSCSRSAKTLLAQLEERGFLTRFSADDENMARYIFHNKRAASWEDVECLAGGQSEVRQLPPPDIERISLASALGNRYSSSTASHVDLSPENLSILLALTYGLFESTDGIQRRAAPSAGGLYPLTIYLSLPCREGIENLLYDPVESQLTKISVCSGSIRGLCNGQEIVDSAKGLVTYVYKAAQNTSKYGPRGLQFALIECGHAAQNLLLGAAGLRIGSRCIGAVDFDTAKEAFNLQAGQIPLYAVALY